MEKSILEMARGAIMERTDYEMGRIIENILDPNTSATSKRKLTITVEFKPDDSRQTVGVSVSAKSTIVPTNAVTTALFVQGDPVNGVNAVEMVPQIPGQVDMNGESQEESPRLRFVTAG